MRARDAPLMRPMLARHRTARFVATEPFPRPPGVAPGASLHALNVLGAPFARRVVWLDPTVLVRHSVDSLCALPGA